MVVWVGSTDYTKLGMVCLLRLRAQTPNIRRRDGTDMQIANLCVVPRSPCEHLFISTIFYIHPRLECSAAIGLEWERGSGDSCLTRAHSLYDSSLPPS